MKRTNTIPSHSTQEIQQETPNDTAPKGRYKSVMLTPRHGTSPSSNSKLSPTYLHTFGFANPSSSSQPETSKPIQDSPHQTASSGDECANVWSLDGDSLPPSPTSPPPPPANNIKEKYLVLSESKLNVLSYNLSEIADRISPTTYEIDQESLGVLIDQNVGPNPSETNISNSEQPTRFKTPYSRQRKDSKTYVSKQKSFTRKRSLYGRHDSQQEMNNNGEISVDASNVLNFPVGNVEGFKQDSESDSGYSSSMSTSISLSEDIEAAKRLSLENGTNTDIEADDLTFNGDDHATKSAADNPVTNEYAAGDAHVHQKTSNVEESPDSLLHGMSSGINNLNLNIGEASKTSVNSQKATTGISNGLDEPSTRLSHNENIPTPHEHSKELAKSPFNLQKAPLDDSALPRTKTGRRPGLQRRRTTMMSFRPPKQMTVQEGESDIVEMDEAGFVQMLTDFKSLKTQLLKLKRELQEADVVSPLMHSHSCVIRKSSVSKETDLVDRTPLQRKRMLLHRTTTMDSATMIEKLHRSSSSSSTGGGLGSLNDIAETPASDSARKQLSEPNTGKEEEMKKLCEELEEVKAKLIEITEERNSLMIAREELEHELDSKIHTIRLLQKQLESQSDSQDEMAYLKRQVKSLTNQIQQQQQKITELRYRATSPGPVPMGAHKKEAVKADIRNRLRDAFVKHLGESSKSNVQLSKYIQKAEQSITMAQKDKSGTSFQRSDSQSSVERSQEDSDGKEYDSDSSRRERRGIASSSAIRNSEDSGSESGKSVRRCTGSPSTFRSQDESDRRASDSDSEKSRRRLVASSPFEHNTEETKSTDSEPDSVKTVEQIEVSDANRASKLGAAVKPAPRGRRLSRSKLLNKIEASPLSLSWTPGAIEKIVKSLREAKSPASHEKTKEEAEKTLQPVSHVQIL